MPAELLERLKRFGLKYGFPWPTVMILDMGENHGILLWAEWLSSIRIKGRCSFVELTELCRNTTSCNSKRNSVPLRTLCGVRLPDKELDIWL